MKAQETQTDVQKELAALGFVVDRRLGMNVLKHSEGETLVLKITGDISDYEAKELDKVTGKNKVYKYVEVDNLKTGESGMTYWLSGQLVYNLKQQKDGFIGGCFAITHKGKTEVDGQYINQFDILALKDK